MDETYDAIVLGTGLKECIISGLLSSVEKLKVLHIDRNNYYGGASASLNLNQLWERFRAGQAPPKSLGASRDYNVDLVPKFIMANGNLVRVLVVTDVTKYLEFKPADGSYVLNKGRVEKVPATDYEALRSPLLGLFEKRRARNFFLYVQDYAEKDPRTHKGNDLTRMTMAELYKSFGLEAQTVDFIGHAIALHRDDSYLREPALETVKKIKLYNDSLHRFEGTKSPYIYPLYGLGELPQAFARLSAVYGGTYMLSKPDAKVLFDQDSKAIGVESEGQVAKAKFVVGDPSYFPDKVVRTSNVVRAICILSHPIPNTDNSHSVQIILPQKQVSRRSDIYVFCCSYAHQCATKDKWVAFVSTTVETNDPEKELRPGSGQAITRGKFAKAIFTPTFTDWFGGLSLLGRIDEKMVEVTPVFEPETDGRREGAYISKGYDATSHFETTVDDVLDMYTRITGKTLDLNNKHPQLEQAE